MLSAVGASPAGWEFSLLPNFDFVQGRVTLDYTRQTYGVLVLSEFTRTFFA
jgi:hypothetical protein